MYFDLSKREIQILEFIKENISTKGYPPSMREICTNVNLKSTSTVSSHLLNLEKKGYIIRDASLTRAIALRQNTSKPSVDTAVNLPIISSFSSNKGIFDSDNISGYMPFPKLLINEDSSFIYINQGDNMKEFSIFHKDYIIVDSKGLYRDGDLVLVLIHGEFTSIRKYYSDGDFITLKSHNDLVLDKSLVKVLGVVTGMFRTFL